MKISNYYKSKKYLRRILFSITLLIVIFVTVTSAAMYYTSEQVVLNSQNEANEKILAQINYNITTMNELVYSMAVSLFYDPEIIPLMAKSDIKVFDLLKKLRKLDSTVNTTSFLHSIVVYNSYSQQLYSGGNTVFRNLESTASQNIYHLLEQGEFEKMELTPISLSESDSETDVFSYVIFDSIHSFYGDESAVILNVKPEWLFNNIKIVNDLAMKSENQVFLVNGSGEILNTAQQPNRNIEEISEFLTLKLGELDQDSGYFRHKIGSQKSLISYSSSMVSDMYVVNIQPYAAVLDKIYQMRTVSIIMTSAFLLLSLLFSIWVSHKLYKPVGSLISSIKENMNNEIDQSLPAKDELSYVSNVYKHMNENLLVMREEQKDNKKILQTYHLRKLLTDSAAISQEEFSTMINQNGLQLHPDSGYVLGIMKINDYSKFIANTTEQEVKLFNFAILNIAEEVISKWYTCETVDMRNNYLVILLKAKDENVDYGNLTLLFREIQEVVLNYYKITIEITLSQTISSYKEITHHYGLSQQYAMYRLVFGKKTIITPNLVKSNIENTNYQIPVEYEKAMSEGLKSKNIKQYEDALSKTMEHISKLNYDYIIYSITHMVVVLKNTLKEMNNNRIQPFSVDLNLITQKIIEMKSLHEIREQFITLFHEISENQKQVNEEKYDILAETIKDYIKENYMDNSLNLQGISGVLRMSADYVGRLFKKSETISVADYINEVRLLHAQKLLENKNYSINEVMDKVGYANQSTFFKLFKKKFGTTPGEFRLKRSIE